MFRSIARAGPWLILLAYSGLAVLMTYPLALHFGTVIPGDGFDGWQNYWNLWWVRVALLEQGGSPLYTHLLYHPTGVSLAFQTLNLFNGLASLPIQLCFGLFPAYNAAACFSFVAGGFGAFLLARYALGKAGWRGRWTIWPALVGGVIFAFSPFHFAHLLGHMQVLSLEWLPFAALSLVQGMDRLDEKPAQVGRLLRTAALSGLFLILVGLCDWYYALYAGLFSGLLILYRLFGRRLRGRHLLMLGLAWSLFLIALAPMWAPMAREAARSDYMVPEEAQALTLSADLLAFFTPNEFHPIWGKAASRFAERFTSSPSERIIFAGYLPLALGLLAACKVGRASRLWWIATLTFTILALGPILHIGGQSQFTPWNLSIPLPYMALYRALPVIRIARSISRLDVMVMLSLSVLAALGLAWLIQRRRRRTSGGRPALLGLAAVGLICFEFLSIPYPLSPPDTPAFYHDLAAEPAEGAVLNLPMNWDRPGYLLYQTVHQWPLTAGYITREDPNTLVYRAPVLQEFRFLGPDILTDDAAGLGASVLGWMDIRYVILDRYKMPAGLERDFTTALAGAIFAGVAPAYEDERLTVYRVAPPADRLPFPVLGQGWGPRAEGPDGVYRTVEDQAELWVQSAPGQRLRLTVRAEAPPGRTLRLRAPDGTEAELGHSADGAMGRLDWTSEGNESLIALEVEGSGDALRIRSAHVESAPR